MTKRDYKWNMAAWLLVVGSFAWALVRICSACGRP